MIETCYGCGRAIDEDDDHRIDDRDNVWCDRCWMDALEADEARDLREYAEREAADQEFEDDLDL